MVQFLILLQVVAVSLDGVVSDGVRVHGLGGSGSVSFVVDLYVVI